ncbi:FAD:protein FMN transferase, partial [Erwinia amylovora]|uniref:FAD:protein FMN transferase n=1 Tax=Erwinia amylovora TaxID=552 RepID=UPI00200AAD56
MADLVSLALRIGQQSGGAMDFTFGPLVNLWWFGPSRQPLITSSQPQFDTARALTGPSNFQVVNRCDQSYLQID